MNKFFNNLNDEEKKILVMYKDIDIINRLFNNNNILIRQTHQICEKCNRYCVSDYSHYYCYYCIINNKRWLLILQIYSELIKYRN